MAILLNSGNIVLMVSELWLRQSQMEVVVPQIIVVMVVDVVVEMEISDDLEVEQETDRREMQPAVIGIVTDDVSIKIVPEVVNTHACEICSGDHPRSQCNGGTKVEK